MKRKLLLFSLLLALFAPWAAKAQTTVTIGDPTSTTTNTYLPTYSLYNYSLTQQIYTADEIGTAGTISSLTMWLKNTSSYARNLNVYMTEVSESTFASGSAWVSISASNLVGSFTLANGISDPTETTVTLSTPFAYSGNDNLVICIQDMTGSWNGGAAGVVMTAEGNQALYVYRDASAYDPSNPGVTGTMTASKNVVSLEITPAGGPSCQRPDEFTAGNLTSNSAILTWTGGEGTYNVEYKKASDQEWTSALTNSTLTQIELSGLAPGTNYQARVQSACGTDPETGDPFTSGWRSVSFATMFGIPLIEPFATTTIPNGWARYSGLLSNVMSGTALTPISSYWTFGTGYNGVFDSHAYINNYSTGHYFWLVTPAVLMENNVELSFDLALTVYTSGSNASPTPGNQADDKFVVLITTDGGTTWEILREWNNTGSEYVYDNITNAITGQYETIDLSSYAGQNIAVAFYAESTVSGGDNNLHLDNVSIDYIPSCPKPTGLAYSDVTGHTANLTWTPGAEGQTQWQICLNGDEENLIPVTSAEGAYTLTGLTGTTPYTAKVRAYCSETDQSPWSNQVSFTTDVTCVAPTAFAVSEVTNRNAKLSWTSEGTDWIVAYKLTSAHDSTYVEVPVTENPYILEGLTPETGYTVKVRNNCGEVDGLSTWSATRTFNTLVAYPAPINVTVDSVFAYTAYLSWDELGTATDWEVEYKLATDTDYTMSELTPDNHPFMLGGLEPLLPGTDYVIRVRSIYFTEQGDTASAWSNEVPFTTLLTCPAPTELTVIDSTINAYGATLTWNANYADSYNVTVIPYEIEVTTYVDADFEDQEIPATWTNDATYPWVITDASANEGTYSIKSGNYNIGSSTSSIQITVDLVAEGTISFAARCSSEQTNPTYDWDYGTFYIDDVQQGDRFINSTTFESRSYDVEAGTHTFMWRYKKDSSVNSNDDCFYVDNIMIASSSFVILEGSNYPAEEATITLNDLQPDTHYMVKVTSFCGEETSEESETVSFTTKPSCLAPTELAVANESVTAHAATLSWTENGSATEWVIEYTAVVNDSTTVTNTINVTENPYTLTGLLAETPYAVKVQAYCSTTDQSDWSNTARFVTLVACPAPTELAVDEESITTNGATLTWNGTSDSYILMVGEPDPENLVEGTMFYVDFETGNQLPADFTTTTNYPWTVVANSHSGAYCAKSYSGADSQTSSMEIEMTFNSNVTLTFSAQVSSESSYDKAYFYIDEEAKINGISGSGSWIDYSYPMTAGTHTLRWSYTKDVSVSSYDDCFYVDNIKITGLVPVPSSWEEYTVEETTYTFDDLTPGTTYFVQVKSDCGEEGESLPSAAISFTTVATCEVPTDFAATDVTAHTATLVWNGENDSYVVNYRVAAGTNVMFEEDFENGNIGDWNFTSMNTENVGGTYGAGLNSTAAHSGSYGFRFSSYNSADDYDQYLVSPELNMTGELKFYAKVYGSSDYLYFGISTTTNDVDAFTWTEIGSTSWQEFTQELTSDVKYIAFHYYGDYAYYAYVDDITITEPTPAGEWMTATTAETTVMIEGLIAETTYEAMVQAVCTEEDSSAFTDIITFTTAIACPAPISLAIANVTDSITAHTATINWLETGSASEWQICVNGDEDNLIIVNDTIFTLTGLAQDADITVKVRANCGDEDGTSAWSNTLTFHTLVACARPTNLTEDNIGTESVTLMWEGESDSYLVQYVPYNQIGEDQTSTGVLTPYTYDLSEFEGMGTIVIRHYDVSDLFRLNVDDIMVTNAQGDTIFSEDFEGTVSSQLSIMDRDGDGYNWYLDSSTGVDAQGNPYCNGSNFITSASYDNSVGALEPDNWLIISGVELGGQLTFVARAQDPEWSAENFAVFVSPEEGAGEETVEGDNMLDLWDLTPNTSYAWQVQGICGEDVSQWATSFFTTMDDVLVFVTDGDWDNVDNWEPAELPTTDKNVRIEANAIIPAGVIAEANKVTIEEGGSITIKDGGQLKQSSATLQVTMEKEITGYGEGTGNYYLISSPFTGRTQFGESSWNHVENLIGGTYDLYTFDPTFGEGEEWVNYKANSSHIAYQSEAQGNAGLFEEIGYLYANQDTITLNFIGKTGKSNNVSTEPKALVCDSINKGWALVGNYFACNAYLTVVDSIGETMEANYYVMNAAGDNLVLAETTDGIAPLNSAFVYLETTGYYQLQSDEPTPAKYGRTGKFIMNLSQGSENVDQAVVRFGKGRNLEKMSLKNNSKLYFTMKDKDYAVVYTMRQGEMPVNFKAETAGSYTINFAADGVSFKELVLVDNVNETKVDLLANPSYTFETEAGEFAGRFTIVYRVK